MLNGILVCATTFIHHMQKPSSRKSRTLPSSLVRWQLAAVLMICGIAVALTFAVPAEQWQSLLQNLLANQGWKTSLLLFGLYIVAVILMLPLSPFALTAGLFLGFWLGTLISLVAINLGALVSFAISRRYLHSDYFKLSFSSKSMRLLTSNDIKIISLLRLNPIVPFSFHNYLYGAARTKLKPYLWGTLIGSAPFTLLLVYFGVTGRAIYSAGASIDGWHYTMLGIGVVLSVALLALTQYAKSSPHFANKE
ncbi:MAG: hypothetical protein C0463_06635 [Idiomarina sp.]|nr:hypothetical protein [Idiomarina sp.]